MGHCNGQYWSKVFEGEIKVAGQREDKKEDGMFPAWKGGMRTTQKSRNGNPVRPPALAITVEAKSPTLALLECTMPLA